MGVRVNCHIECVPYNIVYYKSVLILSARQFKQSNPALYSDIISRAPGSMVIGLLEQSLYVYCLTSTHREFIGSILLFKGFLSWLEFSAAPSGSTPAAAMITGHPEFTEPTTDTRIRVAIPETPVVTLASSTRGQSRGMLAGFYAYAIGNFISLAIAIFVFEVVHLWASRFSPLIFSGVFFCSK